MSLNRSWSRAQIGGLIFVALVGAELLGTKALLEDAKGGDVTSDGAFTISDVFVAAVSTFAEPARHLTALAGEDVLIFLEIGYPEPSWWVSIPIATVLWLAAWIGAAFLVEGVLHGIGLGFLMVHGAVMRSTWKPRAWIAGDVWLALIIGAVLGVPALLLGVVYLMVGR
jgi:hypothetical protein